MHSAQSSEAIAASILSTLSEFESDHQHPNSGHTEDSVHNLGWDPSEPTLVHEQNAPVIGAVHNNSQSFTDVHDYSQQDSQNENPPFSGPVHDRSQSFTHVHHRKPRPDNVLMALSDEDRELLNEWLAAYSYTQVLELLARPRSEGGLEVRSHRASLSRYYERVMHEWLAERRQRSLQIAKHFNATVEPGQFDLPTAEAVKQRTFETVINPQADPGLLKTLLRTFLKLGDQQLAREKLDLATAKTIQAERIAQIEATGGNPYRTPVTQIETILKEQVTKRAAQTAPKPDPAADPIAESSHPLSPIISAVTAEGPTPLLDPLTVERQKIVAILKAKLQLDAQTAQRNPNSPPSTALGDLQDSLEDILAARTQPQPDAASGPTDSNLIPVASPSEDIQHRIEPTQALAQTPAAGHF